MVYLVAKISYPLHFHKSLIALAVFIMTDLIIFPYVNFEFKGNEPALIASIEVVIDST